MGGKVVGGTMETVVGGERGVEGPGSEVVKGELGLWEQVVPAVRREGDVGGREDGDKVVFGGTNCSFRRVRAMVKGRDVLEGDGDRAKERCEVRRSLVVEDKMGQRVRKRAKKGDNRLEGRYVGRGSAGHHGVQVDVPMMQDDEQVLVSCRRFDRETTGQIGGRPMGPVEGEGVVVEGGVKEIGRDKANSGMRERSGGALFVPLSFLLFLGGERRGKAARQDVGRIRRVDAMPCLSWSR